MPPWESVSHRHRLQFLGSITELIRATQGAHNTLLNLEDMEASELDQVRQRYADLAEQARLAIEKGQQDTDAPEVEE